MAKHREATPKDAKGKVTFVMFQVEGSDETKSCYFGSHWNTPADEFEEVPE